MSAEYFDETVYQRALASGESEKSARARATVEYGTGKVLSKTPQASEVSKEPHPIAVDPVSTEKQYLSHSDFFWQEFFNLLRWVIGAAVIIIIAILITSPKPVLPCC